MIACLVSGRLVGNPVRRVSRNDCAFVTGKLRASTGGESVYVSRKRACHYQLFRFYFW
jgi:hypothetical protein